MALRFRKRVGPFTVGKTSASLRLGGRRAGASVSSRGRASASFRLLPGVSFWKKLR